MEQLFTGYPCEIIVDDILVWGRDIAENDYSLEKELQRAKEVNLKLSTKKCKSDSKTFHTLGTSSPNMVSSQMKTRYKSNQGNASS